jgi:cytochrome c5
MAGNGIGAIRRSLSAFLKTGLCISFVVCTSLGFSGLSYGQEEHGSALPDGDGKQLFTFVCSQCHGLRETQILRDGQKGWEEVVDRMVLYGAQLSPSEADLVTRYLAAQLGPGTQLVQKPQRASGDRAKIVSLPEGPGKELVSARCARCHDLEKVVSSTRSKADWESITINMVQRGMPSTPDETQKIISYLQAHFGR